MNKNQKNNIIKSKKNKICVIGAGGWGKNHINTLNRLGNLYGIVDKDKNILNNYNNLNEDCNFHSSVEEAILFGYDGYIIATPAETHYPIAKKLLSHSKNILVEKPVCLTSKDAEELYELAKSNHCFIMGGHLLLFHPAFLKIKSLIDSNKIGDVLYMYSNRLNFGKVRSHENAMWSLAPHDISLLLLFCKNFPEKINYNGFELLGRKIEDSSVSSFVFPGKIGAHIFVSWLHPFKEHRFVVIGKKGMLVYEDSSERKEILFYDKTVNHNEMMTLNDEGSNAIEYDSGYPLDAQLNFFIKSIESKSNNLDNFKLSINVVKILESLRA
jgi:UDP-2-acetamido-3-amino-2,3-dideoxy-glucuronate N-acetyltransferase